MRACPSRWSTMPLPQSWPTPTSSAASTRCLWVLPIFSSRCARRVRPRSNSAVLRYIPARCAPIAKLDYWRKDAPLLLRRYVGLLDDLAPDRAFFGGEFCDLVSCGRTRVERQAMQPVGDFLAVEDFHDVMIEPVRQRS